VEDHHIDGPAGPIPVRVYWPESGGPHPVTLFFHGGGFALGDLDTHDVTARQHAVGADSVVVSGTFGAAVLGPYRSKRALPQSLRGLVG